VKGADLWSPPDFNYTPSSLFVNGPAPLTRPAVLVQQEVAAQSKAEDVDKGDQDGGVKHKRG
jgi:hypothetical protein